MKRRLFSGVLGSAALAVGCAFGAGRPDVMAIYYPCWAPTPALESHFGRGWTEWAYVESAPPRFPGHQQPIVPTLGHLRGDDPGDVAKEIDLAADHGIDVFLFDYYYYGGFKLMHESLENGFLKAKNRNRLKFAIMWCCHEIDNEFRPDPAKPRERLFTLAKTETGFAMLMDACLPYFREPNYYRHNGKLYFSIYSPQVMIAEVGVAGMRRALDAAREKVRAAGLGEIEFNAQGGPANTQEMVDAGFDSLTDYVFNTYNDTSGQRAENGGSWTFDYGQIGARLRAHWAKRAQGPLPYNPVVPTGWDPTPRARIDVTFPQPTGKSRYPYGEIYTNATPHAFGKYLEMAKAFVGEDPRRSIVQLYAWNEYTEGGWLLPDTFTGDARLKEVKRVMGRGDAKPMAMLKVSALGFDPEDSTEFLQRAFDSGAPRIVIDKQAGDWIACPLYITNSNVEVVLEDGVTLRAKRGEFHGLNDCLVSIAGGAENVVLRGEGTAALAMNKADYANPEFKYAFSEWRHTLSIGDSRNVTVRNLTMRSSGGDGIYVNFGASGVTLEDVRCIDHFRQGMSPIRVSGMTVRRCVFNDTAGAPPQCGIDMEPNRPSDYFTDVLYEDCVFNGNAAHGIDLYFGSLNGTSRPVSVTFRRCVAKGNRGSGLSFMAGEPKNLADHGQVKGTVTFEACKFLSNGAEAVKIINHTTNGMSIAFKRCRFDARGSAAESAVAFSNVQVPEDMGGVTFEDCAVLLDRGRVPFLFEAQPGIGIGGALAGRVGVDVAGARSLFDLAAFRAANAPDPSRVTRFKSSTVDFRAIAAPAGGVALEGVATPHIRSPFVFVQAVPAAGEHSITFRSQFVRPAGEDAVAGVVQMLDAAGTDLGKFEIPGGDYVHTFRTQGANVCRFEVSPRNSAVLSVESHIPGGALLADRPLHFFHGGNERCYFRVPKGAREVLVDLAPEEPGSAQLFDAKGVLRDESPCVSTAKVLKAEFPPCAADEIWLLKFPRIVEDYRFQLGGDAVPLVSTERAGVPVERR